MSASGKAADRARGALLGTAVGDCFGAPFEGAPIVWPDELGPLEGRRGSLRWTDDTHMTIVLAEELVEFDGEVDPERLAHRFASAYSGESWRGYGPGPPRIFRALGEGVRWDLAAQGLHDGEGSLGNGAAMRVAPCAVAARGDVERAVALAEQQARPTHAHALGIDGARVQAAAVAARFGGATVAEAIEVAAGAARVGELRERVVEVAGLPPGIEAVQVVTVCGNGVTALEAVPAALACAGAHPDDPLQAIRMAICLGGDTDTIAAMAGSVVAAGSGESSIPSGVLERIEAVDRLRELADALLG